MCRLLIIATYVFGELSNTVRQEADGVMHMDIDSSGEAHESRQAVVRNTHEQKVGTRGPQVKLAGCRVKSPLKTFDQAGTVVPASMEKDEDGDFEDPYFVTLNWYDDQDVIKATWTPLKEDINTASIDFDVLDTLQVMVHEIEKCDEDADYTGCFEQVQLTAVGANWGACDPNTGKTEICSMTVKAPQTLDTDEGPMDIEWTITLTFAFDPPAQFPVRQAGETDDQLAERLVA